MRRVPRQIASRGRRRAVRPRRPAGLPGRLQEALSQHVLALNENLPAALAQDVEALHRSRVASRRLREVLPVVEAGTGEIDGLRVRKSRRRVRRLTRALGGVRELDVALSILDEVDAARPDLAGAVAAARVSVDRERAGRRAALLAHLAAARSEELARDLQVLMAAAGVPHVDRQRSLLRRRLERQADDVDEAMCAAGALYAFDRLHRVRIAAKKLRYGLELVMELTRISTKRLVNHLKFMQDLLGRLHDLEIVAGYVRDVAAGPGRRLTAEASRVLAILERDARLLHAQYLSNAARLRAVTAACRDRVCPRLGPPATDRPAE